MTEAIRPTPDLREVCRSIFNGEESNAPGKSAFKLQLDAQQLSELFGKILLNNVGSITQEGLLNSIVVHPHGVEIFASIILSNHSLFENFVIMVGGQKIKDKFIESISTNISLLENHLKFSKRNDVTFSDSVIEPVELRLNKLTNILNEIQKPGESTTNNLQA